MAMTAPAFLQIDGKDYVVIPKAEYMRLTGAVGEGLLVDAGTAMREMLARDLRKAREAAGLTQGQLAEKLAVGQSMVSSAESGKAKVGERYVKRVLKACKLPADWVPEPDAPGKVILRVGSPANDEARGVTRRPRLVGRRKQGHKANARA
jgi:transcriptional regulator with XRE-family HTH domain